jgi:dihydrofolate reductase
MGKVIVLQFVTLDGVIEDPDGSDGTPFGGWAMRHGPEAIGGDKFDLGELMSTAVLLFGHRTWRHFATLWAPRTTEFALAMNEASKAVLSAGPLELSSWRNSERVTADLRDWIQQTVRSRDIVVIGSTSVVRDLQKADLVDEYRLLVFPTAAGSGATLFADPLALELVSTRASGPGSLSIYRPSRAEDGPSESLRSESSSREKQSPKKE